MSKVSNTQHIDENSNDAKNRNITGIQYIDSDFDKTINFENCDDVQNNRTIPARHRVGVGNCWVPWREDDNENMEVKRLILILTPSKKYYIWQHGKHLRYACNTDPKTAAGGDIIPGESSIGSSKDLTVTDKGDLILTQH